MFIKQPIKEIIKKIWDDDIKVKESLEIGGYKYSFTIYEDGGEGLARRNISGNRIEGRTKYKDWFGTKYPTRIRVHNNKTFNDMVLTKIEEMWLIYNLKKKYKHQEKIGDREELQRQKERDKIARSEAQQILSKEI